MMSTTRTRIIYLFFLLMLAPACAKEPLQIGKENPELEIQKCTRLSEKKHYKEAIECLEIYKSRFAKTQHAQEATLKIADVYFAEKEYLLAADAYQNFVKIHPLHQDVDYAMFRTGLSYLKEAPKAIDRDQKYLHRAKEELEKAWKLSYRGKFDKDIEATLTETNERLAKRVFYVGRFYYRTGEYQAAIPRFQELANNYSQSLLLPQALYLWTRCYLELGETDKAREVLETLVANFPKNGWTTKAQKHYKGSAKS